MDAKLPIDTAAVPEAIGGSRYEQLIAYYEEAGPDFGAWSPAFNMHFGYYRFGFNPFRRERMLNDESSGARAASCDRQSEGPDRGSRMRRRCDGSVRRLDVSAETDSRRHRRPMAGRER